VRRRIPRPTLTALAATVLAGVVGLAAAGAIPVSAQDQGAPPPSTAPLGTTPSGTTPPGTVPPSPAPGAAAPGGEPSDEEMRLVPVPPGCVAPPLPDVVFAGTLVDRDFRTGRFEIDQVRAGDVTPFAAGDLIDVRYGLDAQYLEVGESYVVSASREPVLGVLVSQISAPAPDFGGDDVVGVTESDVECPLYEDPVRTLRPDGTSVESGVLNPLFEERRQLLGALVVPIGVAFGVVFALALLRHLINGLVRGVGAVARPRPR
jgi:hypothetical protein